ncbi:acyltransferase family protein [Jiella avicenniae]|uniref:Acyltransferase n=1 Tax=Jiella avicenniae TaxID=2907202 RepID=A0A9X1NVW4_9HYPH|nr:acyltransferase [Jiella avicenniae]MCE7026670.1 acyltransferase [Jiella avicenniae]
MIEGRAAVRNDGARFQALDGWRGVCALLVVCFHAPVTGFAETSGLVRNAFLFVDFFFVLSGFVITHAFYGTLRESRDFSRFFLLRLARVYPLHLAMLLLPLAFECARLALKGPAETFAGGTSVDGLIANLFMVQSFGFLDTLTWNYPSWSISAELVAYAAFAAVVVTAPRLLVPLAALAIVVGLPVIAMAIGNMDASSNLGWLRCLAGFSVGVILRRTLWRDAAAAQARRHPTSWSLAELAVVLLVGIFVSRQGGTDLAFAAPFVFGLALYVFAHEGGIFSRALKTRPFAFLGLISYSIYMTHAFVIDRVHNVASVLTKVTGTDLFVRSPARNELIGPQAWQGTVTLVVIVLGTIVFSALTYRFVEKPGMALGRRLVGRPDRAGTSGEPVKSPAAA